MYIYSNSRLQKDIGKISALDEFDKDFYYHYLFIVSHIRTFPYLDRRYKTGDFIPIQMKVLKKLISYDNAHKFLKNLVDGGILICDNYYVKGLKAKGYRINEEYLKEKFKLVDVKDKKLENKVNSTLKKLKNRVYEESFGYGYVTDCMEDLDIDFIRCKRYIDSLDDKEDVIDSYNIMTEIFDEKFAVVDNKGKRLHNNLTNIATPLRKFISYKGKNIVQVDIKNSQPLFLYLLLKKNYFVGEKEMEKYKKVVTEIGFYEFFSDKMKIELTAENRKKFKQSIFGGVLFDRNRSTLSKYEKVFKEEFPSIFHIIHSIKSVNYEDVAIMLQKTESKFIFYCVEKIAKEYKIPMFTIHDSICTTEGKENIVKREVMEEFHKLYTIEPKLTIDKFV